MASSGWCMTVVSVLRTSATYYVWVAYYLLTGAPPLARPPALLQRWAPITQRQLLQLYSLALTLRVWHQPHYRAPSLRHDMMDNLQNVAIPGTGIPLSLACTSTLAFLLFLVAINPLACLAAAVYQAWWLQGPCLVDAYQQQLLEPNHWLATWRLNSLLVAQHEQVCRSPQYRSEDKGAFLLEGERLGLAVSPFCKEPVYFIKHKSIEGGMGIHVYRNFATGGDYIIQPALQNSAFLAHLLPHGAPLSTLRVLTASERWMQNRQQQQQQQQHPESGQLRQWLPSSYPVPQAATSSAPEDPPGGLQSTTTTTSRSSSSSYKVIQGSPEVPGIEALAAVWRAGLAGANTDHTCVCYPVDLATGGLGEGTSSQHWYQLGWSAAGRLLTSVGTRWRRHPQSGIQVAGKAIPNWAQVLSLAVESHAALCPDVPLAGWDVALTPQGTFLLEANYSCNFFNGTFDVALYTKFMCTYFDLLARA